MNRANLILAAYVVLIGVLLFATPIAAASLPPVITIPDVACVENGACSLIVNRQKASSYTQVQLQSVDMTAKAGVDFQPLSTKITIANSATRYLVPLTLIDNSTYQGDRQLGVKVTVLRYGQLAASYTPTMVTIHDDETPPPPAPAPSTGLAGEQPIASGFDPSTALDLTWTNPRGGIAPPSSDPVGAFRMFMTAGQILKDDPLVYPGRPGASPHAHQFMSNTGANGNSTYASLRTTGSSTASVVPVNRSAYWMPAMLDGAGNYVKPDEMQGYYKRDPLGDPMCNDPTATTGVGQCVGLPNGLRFIFGYNMQSMTGGPNDTVNDPQWFSRPITWQCWDSLDGTVSRGAANGYYRTIEAARVAGCPSGARLMLIAAAPNCWDGKNLDSADHRSHIADSTGPMYPTQMFRACTPDHPYVFPNLEVQIAYTTDANFVAGRWLLASDEQMRGMGVNVVAGSTWHMDYWEAWDPVIKGLWQANCIDKKLTCSEGDLGNGYQIVGAGVPNGGWPKHQTVPLSSIP